MPLKRDFDFSVYDSNLCWAPHPDEVYALTKVKERKEDTVVVEDSEGTSWSVKATDVLAFDVADMLDVDDAASLKNLQEACLLDVVRRRYHAKKIYTNTTRNILIAVNPYEQLHGLYSEDAFRAYRGYTPAAADGNGHMPNSGSHQPPPPPHIFGVADTAFQMFVAQGRSQSIIISGESGSGKSESTKLIVRYLSQLGSSSGSGNGGKGGESPAAAVPPSSGSAAGSNKVSVESRIVESAPLLEAFGNAKTMQNNNSSRFGKFIKVFFDDTNTIYGAHIMHTLLEKTRIVMPGKGERNYHIFYQLCAGAPPQLKADLRLEGGARSFRYLAASDTLTIDGVDDAAAFEHTKVSMTICDVSEEEQCSIWATLAALLHLGNVEFCKAGEGSEAKNPEVFAFAASLLRVEVDKLRDAITKRAITVGRDVTFVLLNPDIATSTRDAFVKNIYSLLFDWLVDRVNGSMTVRERDDEGRHRPFIGVLDIFGFEIFQKNSLEQLHINWANEALQQQFNATMFKGELRECEEEGVQMTRIPFTDNEECLEFIERKVGGVLSILDEACVLPKSTDATFLDHVNRTLSKHSCYVKPKVGTPQFGIRHFAGPVMYTVDGFLQKNTDKVNEQLLRIVRAGDAPFLKSLFAKAIEEFERSQSGPGTKSSATKITTVSASFKVQLQGTLIKTLAQTEPHYVRCIKPNPNKQPAQFHPPLVHLQLKCSGVLEVVRLRRTGYPVRIQHTQFVRQYHACGAPSAQQQGEDDAHRSAAILERVVGQGARWQSGRTKVFLSLEAHAMLDKVRDERLKQSVLRIQSYYRMAEQKKAYQRTYGAVLRIQLRVRVFLARARHRRRVRAATVLQKNWRMAVARRGYERTRRLVVFVQKNVRRGQQAARYARWRHLIVVLQRDARRCVARRAYERLRRASTVVSKSYRRHVAVVALRRAKRAAVDIQRVVRGWVAVRRYCAMRRAAVCVQRAFRAWLRVREARRRRRAATAIQRVARGRAARACYGRQRALVVLLQACVRRWAALRRYAVTRRWVVAAQAAVRMRGAVRRYERQVRSAVVVQSAARAHTQRSAYLVMRRSAVVIQSAVRAHQARTAYAHSVRCTMAAQARARCVMAVRHMSQQSHAALTVQRAWRGCQARAQCRATRALITAAQAAARRVLAAKSLQRQRRAAVKIQTAYRVFMAKLRLDVERRKRLEEARARQEAERQRRLRARAATRIQKAWRGYAARKRYLLRRDVERLRRAEAERKRREGEERARREHEAAERKRLEEAERARKEEEERQRRLAEEAERKRIEEAERLKREDEERRRREEDERQRRLDEERARREEEERRRRDDEERRRREAEERTRQEDEERKRREHEDRRMGAERQAELDRMRIETERQEAERRALLDRLRLEAEAKEAERKADLERMRLEKERAEADKQAELDRLRLETDRQEALKLVELARMQLEQERQELERQKAEAARRIETLERQRAEAERKAELERQVAQLQKEKLEAERLVELERQRIEAEKQAELERRLAQLEREKEEVLRRAEVERHRKEREEMSQRLTQLQAERSEAVRLAELERKAREAEQRAEMAKKLRSLEQVRLEAERARAEVAVGSSKGMHPVDLATKLVRRRSRMDTTPPAQFANILSQAGAPAASATTDMHLSPDLVAKLASRRPVAIGKSHPSSPLCVTAVGEQDDAERHMLADLEQMREAERAAVVGLGTADGVGYGRGKDCSAAGLSPLVSPQRQFTATAPPAHSLPSARRITFEEPSHMTDRHSETISPPNKAAAAAQLPPLCRPTSPMGSTDRRPSPLPAQASTWPSPSVCASEQRALLQDVESAVECIVDHFAAAGTDTDDTELVALVDHLCSTLFALFAHRIVPPASPWQFIATVDLPAATLDGKWAFDNSAGAVETAVHKARFKALICHSLNCQGLSQFVKRIFGLDKAVWSKCYDAGASLRSIEVQRLLIDVLEDLSPLSFNLVLDIDWASS